VTQVLRRGARPDVSRTLRRVSSRPPTSRQHHPAVRGPLLALSTRVFAVGLVLSLAIGLSLGLLGGGGSILTVPVLHYVFAIAPHNAIAMSLVVVALTSGFALIPHARTRNVRWRSGLIFGATSMVFAFAGARIGSSIPGAVLVVAFAALMLVVGTAMLLRAHCTASPIPPRPASIERMLATGVGVGLLTGVLGAGGGFIIVPALVLVAGLTIRESVATSLLVITMNSLAALAGTAGHASIDVGVLVPVAMIAMGGGMLGMRLGRRLSAQQLQRGFGVFIVVIGTAILLRELL
jgi:uncharacterized membrane protein YfcA